MALSVVQVTPAQVAVIAAAHPTLAANFDAKMKCARGGPNVPELPWLLACVNESPPIHAVFVALDGGPVGVMVVHLSSKRIVWLLAHGTYSGGFVAVANAFTDEAKLRYGTAWGIVQGQPVQAAFVGSGLYSLDPVTERLDRH